jgi:hypothetical protein
LDAETRIRVATRSSTLRFPHAAKAGMARALTLRRSKISPARTLKLRQNSARLDSAATAY